MLCRDCGDSVPLAFWSEERCENCASLNWERLGIRGLQPRYVALQTEPAAKSERIANERAATKRRLERPRRRKERIDA